jgi:hypothetical protein
MRLTFLLLCAGSVTAFGQANTPPPDFVERASQWMISTDPAKRQAAYRSWLQLGPGTMEAYEKALRSTLKYHDQKIDKLSRGEGASNPYEAHDAIFSELETERERVMTLIRTDWKKDEKEIAMLREEMEGLTKLHGKVNKLASANTSSFDTALDASVQGMCEITRELERFDPQAESKQLDDEQLESKLVSSHIHGAHLVKLRKRLQVTRDAITRLDEATKARKAAAGSTAACGSSRSCSTVSATSADWHRSGLKRNSPMPPKAIRPTWPDSDFSLTNPPCPAKNPRGTVPSWPASPATPAARTSSWARRIFNPPTTVGSAPTDTASSCSPTARTCSVWGFPGCIGP